MGRTDAVVKTVLGAALLALAAGFTVVAVDPDAAAWLAERATCNGRPCTPANLRVVAPIVAGLLGVLGLLVGGFGVRGLFAPARPSMLGSAFGLLGAMRVAAEAAARQGGQGRVVVDASHDPAVREAVLQALRAYGLPLNAGLASEGRADRLVHLARLRDAGILTAEEYEVLRLHLPPGTR